MLEVLLAKFAALGATAKAAAAAGTVAAATAVGAATGAVPVPELPASEDRVVVEQSTADTSEQPAPEEGGAPEDAGNAVSEFATTSELEGKEFGQAVAEVAQQQGQQARDAAAERAATASAGASENGAAAEGARPAQIPTPQQDAGSEGRETAENAPVENAPSGTPAEDEAADAPAGPPEGVGRP